MSDQPDSESYEAKLPLSDIVQQKYTVGELHDKLKEVSDKKPSIASTTAILSKLIRQEHVQPTSTHYTALLLAQADRERGSAEMVGRILGEMERENMAIGASVYHAALKGLAVHPNYLQRSSVLARMNKQWISHTRSSSHYVIAGLIREGQFELAHQKLLDMHAQQTPVEQWLYSLFIYSLLEHEDFDAVLQLIYLTQEDRAMLSSLTWYHVLDKASEHGKYEISKHVWHLHVEQERVDPLVSMCRNVLSIATEAGDARLAESARKVLRTKEREWEEKEETAFQQVNAEIHPRFRNVHSETHPFPRIRHSKPH